MKRICVLLLAVLMMVSLTACKSDDYKEAMELYVNREYDAALAIFTELGDYEDSSNMVSTCRYAKAHLLMNEGLHEDARAIFEELGDYEDSRENVKECYYLQAVALMEAKEYEAAQQIFTMLGDYKDSAAYVNGMGWYLFANYVSQQGEVRPEGLLYDHTGIITVDAGSLYVEIGNSSNSDLMSIGMTAEVVIEPGHSKADLHATFYMKMGYYEIRDAASTTWDIARYQKGDLVVWDEYDHSFSGMTMDGRPTAADNADTLGGGTGANLITALTDCIQKGLEESGLDVTMADLGFTSYENSPDVFH